MEIPNPADSLLKWFHSLGAREREELAFMVLCHIPGSPSSDDYELATQDSCKVFVDWVQESKNLPPGKFVGQVVALISTIDFFVMAERGSKEAWGKLIERNESTQKSMKEKGYSENDIEPVVRIPREAPIREKRWEKYANSWDELKMRELSWPVLKFYVDYG